jgi:uncharacterized protein (TIGR01777 family)
MHLFISGGTGFVGSHLTHQFLNDGHMVTATGTRARPQLPDQAGFRYLRADTTAPGPWQEALREADVVINLTGKGIFKRWTRRYKRQIYDSRILTTRNIVEALSASDKGVLISTSAVGYYGDRGDEVVTEAQPPADDFLGRVAIDWEKEALVAAEKGTRVVLARFGVVMGRGGGALQQMLPAFKMFAGGPVGTGRQWFPWIHIQDIVEAMAFLIVHKELNGAFNFTAPEPMRFAQVAETIGKHLNRPSCLKTPGFVLKLALGEMAGTLLASQRVVPQRLLDSGFVFQFPQLDQALTDLL